MRLTVIDQVNHLLRIGAFDRVRIATGGRDNGPPVEFSIRIWVVDDNADVVHPRQNGYLGIPHPAANGDFSSPRPFHATVKPFLAHPWYPSPDYIPFECAGDPGP